MWRLLDPGGLMSIFDFRFWASATRSVPGLEQVATESALCWVFDLGFLVSDSRRGPHSAS